MGKRLAALMAAISVLGIMGGAVALTTPDVSFGSAEREGKRVAEVLIGEHVVIVIRTMEDRYTPLERAEIVANRLRAALGVTDKPPVTVRPAPNGQALLVAGRTIILVTQKEAKAHGGTPSAVAKLWRNNIVTALGLTSSSAPSTAADSTLNSDLEDWVGSAQKWVPIFSLETEGLYLGAAQVAGPTAQVEQVKGVAELRLNFHGFARIYAYIPVSTISLTKLDRVQGVSVWATGDIGLVKF